MTDRDFDEWLSKFRPSISSYDYYSVEQYKVFMRKTRLFDMIANHLVNNLVDYALGIETGLDSNGRKNRGGHQMENLVEKYWLPWSLLS